jgi:succinyl-diaminopimelate desuccinylase
MTTLSLIQTLLRCPSVTPHHGGCFEVLEEFLKPLGFEITRVSFGDVTNFYATRGVGNPHLCFAGHVDVVPPGDLKGWVVPPFEGVIEKDRLWGRGVADMKGAIGCFLGATRTFIMDNPSQGRISLLLTSDEEGPAIDGLQRMVPWLRERNIQPDFFLIGEPTGPGPVGEMLKVGRRGSVTGHLRVSGTQGHIAYPHLADNPIPRLIDCLKDLMEMPLDSGTEVFEPSRLEITSVDVANPVTNIIPSAAEARFGLRFNTQHQGTTLCEQIRHVCQKKAGKHSLNLSLHGEAFLTEKTPWIQKIAEALEMCTGKNPKLDTSGGTTDGRFLIHLAPVIECGLPENTIHQVNENVLLSDIEELEFIYGGILRRVFLEPA